MNRILLVVSYELDVDVPVGLNITVIRLLNYYTFYIFTYI